MKKRTQNEPNLLNAQMNISSVLTKDYERNDIFAVPENKANFKRDLAKMGHHE